MITKDLQQLDPGALVEFFELDLTDRGGDLLRFHAGVNELGTDVVWQGNTYTRFPIEADGFDVRSSGTMPRPKVRVANISGLMGAEAAQYDDLVGAKFTRKRTFTRYLDAVNFTGAVNPDADPNQHLPDDLWFIEQKTSENRLMIEWELASAFDLQGTQLPNRQVIQNTCVWKYKSAECGYTGTDYFDANDAPTTVLNDFCAKRMSSCRKRFTENVPFGGFPGSIRYD
jgi:lambda family phage minor tail protein L